MYKPLAESMRPQKIEDVVGQTHLLGDRSLLTQSIKEKKPLSLLFWGPPGCGKTTLARIYAQAFEAQFISLSAVSTGAADLKKIVAGIQSQPLFRQLTVVFVDEIHRYDKRQQDFVLPYVEKGTFILLGATTENPSFSLNDALLSRLRVLPLQSLQKEELEQLLLRYEEQSGVLPLDEKAREQLLQLAQGDARYLFNLIENLRYLPKEKMLNSADLQELAQKRAPLFDRSGDGHYNLISALHKAVRGSDPDASLYWFARMVEGGEDPLFIARRLIRMATEDVGLADPQALGYAIAARDAYQMLGSPEGELALAQVVVYLALSPKSNRIYQAYTQAKNVAQNSAQLPPPKIILNAPTQFMKEQEYGKGYQYDHNLPTGFSGQNYFPDELSCQTFYEPVPRGFEREMEKRKEYFNRLREKFPTH